MLLLTAPRSGRALFEHSEPTQRWANWNIRNQLQPFAYIKVLNKMAHMGSHATSGPKVTLLPDSELQ